MYLYKLRCQVDKDLQSKPCSLGWSSHVSTEPEEILASHTPGQTYAVLGMPKGLHQVMDELPKAQRRPSGQVQLSCFWSTKLIW